MFIKKTASGTLRFDPYCPSKDLKVIQISIKSFFFDTQKRIQKNVSGTICFDPYHLFKDINVHPTLICFLLSKIY